MKTNYVIRLLIIFWLFPVAAGLAADCKYGELSQEQKEKFSNAALFASMACDVYDKPSSGSAASSSDSPLFADLGWHYNNAYDSSSSDWPGSKIAEAAGFHAGVYEDGDGNLVVSFEGTSPDSLANFGKDLANDLLLAANQTSAQHALAISYMGWVVKNQGNKKIVGVTGHSLGGSLAQLVSQSLGYPAYTFNSAAVPDSAIQASKVANVSIDVLEGIKNQMIEQMAQNGLLSEAEKQFMLSKKLEHPESGTVQNFVHPQDLVNPGSALLGSEHYGDTTQLDYDTGAEPLSPLQSLLAGLTGPAGSLITLANYADVALSAHSCDKMADYLKCVHTGYLNETNAAIPSRVRPSGPIMSYPENDDDSAGTIIRNSNNNKQETPPELKGIEAKERGEVKDPGEIKDSGEVKDPGEIKRLTVKPLPW